MIKFRLAETKDLKPIIGLLVDDDLGRTREALTPGAEQKYRGAFEEIQREPSNELLVGERGDEIISCLQITYIPGLTLQGSKRALIEGVRVHSKYRGQGMGRMMIEEVFRRARLKNCQLVELTTHKSRMRAHKFYETMGFQATSEGMKFLL